MTPWSDAVYGFRPAFVFLSSSPYRSNYSWDVPGDEESENPLWLEVVLDGLTLFPDLWELWEVTSLGVSRWSLVGVIRVPIRRKSAGRPPFVPRTRWRHYVREANGRSRAAGD